MIEELNRKNSLAYCVKMCYSVDASTDCLVTGNFSTGRAEGAAPLLGDDARFSELPYRRGLSRVADPPDTGFPLDEFVMSFLSTGSTNQEDT